MAQKAQQQPPQNPQPAPPLGPQVVRRYVAAGGGFHPELGVFLGAGGVLAEELDDGTHRIVSEPAEPDAPVAAEPAAQSAA